MRSLATDAPASRRQAWWLAATNQWRTAARCTRPEPRHLLQSGSEGTQKAVWEPVFECALEAPKAGDPLGHPSLRTEPNYFSSALAPASTSFFRAASASALGRPSL